MSLKKINFGDKEVDKKKFYSPKEAILLDSVDLSKIVVSSRYKINDTTYNFFCGYLNNNSVKSFCVILPQVDGYIKYFDDGGKNMSFITDDEKIYEKYNGVWEAVNPVRDDKYLVAKLTIFAGINRITFNNNSIPIERNHYICIPAIDIDSVLKIDNRAYPQAYLEQCKYKLKKRKIVNYIDDEIIDEDSAIDGAIDSYVVM